MSVLEGAMAKLLEENKRLKSRCKMLRKLRHVVVVMVKEPNDTVVGSYSIPVFAMEKNHSQKMNELIGRFRVEFNQEVSLHEIVACDTMADLESAMMSLNQVDDQKE